MTFKDDPIKPGGWTTGEKLTAAQITAIDDRLSNAVDREGDEITSTIEFTGAGTISIFEGGSLSLYGAGTDGYVTDSAILYIGENGEQRVHNGGTLIVEDTGELRISDGGELIFDGSDDWPSFNNDRTLTKTLPAQVIGTSVEGGATAGDAVAWPGSTTDGPSVVTQSLTATGEWFRLELPLGPKNSTLDSVSIWSKGYGSSVSVTLPTYRVQSVNVSGSSLPSGSNVSSTTTDSHASDGSDWTDWVKTTISGINHALFSPDSKVFWVYVTPPYSAGGSGMYVLSVTASYSVSQLRF